MLFTYMLRGMVARRSAVLPTMFSIAAAVAVVCVMVAALESLRHVLLDSGSESNGIVVSQNSMNDWESSLAQETLQRIAVAPGIKQDASTALISGELRIQLRVRRADGSLAFVSVRGVDPVALKVHPQVHVVEGKAPESGSGGVMIGSMLVGRYPGFGLGGTIRFGRRKLTVVGIFRAPGTKFESEIWAGRSDVAEEFKLTGYSLASFILERPEALAGVERAVVAMHDQRLDTLSERAYYRRAFLRASTYVSAVEIMIMVLALSVLFSTTNTMYAAYLERVGEMGTLLAIGFRRRSLAWTLFQESILIALVSGALGLAVASLASGYSIYYPAMGVTFSLRISTNVALVGGGVALAVGALGALVTVRQVLRLTTLEALRAG